MTGTAHLTPTELTTYQAAQAIARSVLEAIRADIRPGATERQLLERCRQLMDAGGATDYWWFGVPALVLAGPRLRDSMEGDVYVAADTPVGMNDMVTIDLAPEINGFWGDCARSYFLKNGALVSAAEAGLEQAEGVAAESRLHAYVRSIAHPDMLFCELHTQVEWLMRTLDFENLDFLGNFGHSIGRDLHARAFIDANCRKRLAEVPLFTFEPHIAKPGSAFAFKYEEIYRFVGDRLELL